MMKTFKFGLVGLLVGLIFPCFGYCEDEDVVEDLINVIAEGNFTALSHWEALTTLSNAGSFCIYFHTDDPTYTSYLQFWIEGSTPTTVHLGVNNNTWGCMTTPNSNQKFWVKSNMYQTVAFDFKIIEVNELLTTALPKMTSLECQTDYNLIPINDVDTNYCVENDLCPVPDNFSQLFINEIEHQSYPVINVSIPDEFSWDYTGNNGTFDLNIIGYNIDTEYIEGIINTQNSKPNNQDFNNIITGVLPLLIPGFVVIMFIYFIFRLIKKLF